ncbi:hypothetical protein GCM10011504_54110 [Siccirubricoccus deserti]|uniref:Uncharacterized protein n=1 Tax=Siccirubricoccus deserti TaxID=2013562 RepID=A0A9X0UGV7_9PROT|nr:hypothetical protein [Siccirubricoccus deserti]MBC4019363.1 hypothetical protein [Siccirubricoccus deserti]GGC69402.1 hypothetical protein GCM10011504_54110 [Siccirubricoccus deserti]
MAWTGAQYRQGDVLLVAAAHLPPDLMPMPVPADQARALMPPATASAAATHLVPLVCGLRAFRSINSDGSAESLEITGGSLTLTHPEQAPLTLEPCIWRIVWQRRYDPATAGAAHHAVAD